MANLSSNKSFLDSSASPHIKKPLKFGLYVLAIFVVIFLIWGVIAPLESAAVANGKIIVDTNRKTIQHLEGGIVEKIYVRDGSVVKQGDPLIQLDTTQAKARLQLVDRQVNELSAAEARLIAERDGVDKITFPDWLLKKASTDPAINQIIKGQESIFAARQKTFNDSIAILNQRIKQQEEQIVSLKSQATSYENQLTLIKEETAAVESLLEKKYVDRPRYLALKREAERLIGNRDEQLALAAQTSQKIGETKMQMISLESERQNKTVQELRTTQNDLGDAIEKQKAAEDILQRTLIRAPRSGTVVNLQVHTLGGVISPGQAILDIVPNDDTLVIEARVSPLDIDVVHPNLIARVRLTAYKQRTTPVLTGKVTEVSADILQDPKTAESYFTARITINPKELKQLNGIHLYPGMPAQVLIVTDRQTFLTYLIKPIKDSFHRAFHEQ